MGGIDHIFCCKFKSKASTAGRPAPTYSKLKLSPDPFWCNQLLRLNHRLPLPLPWPRGNIPCSCRLAVCQAWEGGVTKRLNLDF